VVFSSYFPFLYFVFFQWNVQSELVVSSLELPPGLFIVRLAFFVVVTNIAGQQNRAVPVPPPRGEVSCDGGLPFFMSMAALRSECPAVGVELIFLVWFHPPLFFFILPGPMAELRRVFFGTFPVQGLFNDGMPMPVEFAGQQPPNPYPTLFVPFFVGHLRHIPKVGIQHWSSVPPSYDWRPTFFLFFCSSSFSFFPAIFCCTSITFFGSHSEFRIKMIHSYVKWRRRQSQKGNGPFWTWLFLSYPQRWYFFWCASFWPPVIYPENAHFFPGCHFCH
jgi:hypothetical protein